MKKCEHCVEGKLLPAIPNPKMKQFPDCDYCNGTGFYEVNAKWYYEGLRLKDLRIASRTTLRRFCIDNELDAVEISKAERGIIEMPKEIVEIYEITYKQRS